MKNGSRLVILLLVVSLVLGVVGCAPEKKPVETGGETPPQDEMASIIHFGRDWPTYYDPGVGSSYTCQVSHANIYDPLVFPNIDGTVDPHVATSWEATEDGLTYTFKIRQDIKFHSGNLLKASDVAFSMNRLLTIGEGFSHLYTGVVEECYATDDETVVMKLASTFGPFVSTLTRFFILEESAVREHIDTSVDTANGETMVRSGFSSMTPARVRTRQRSSNSRNTCWESSLPITFLVLRRMPPSTSS